MLRDYCGERGVAYQECGKVLVATNERELARLDDIEQRAEANGVPKVTRLTESELRLVEPHVGGLGGLHSPTTAIVDFAQVARSLRDEVRVLGATVRFRAAVSAVRDHGTRPEVELADR